MERHPLHSGICSWQDLLVAGRSMDTVSSERHSRDQCCRANHINQVAYLACGDVSCDQSSALDLFSSSLIICSYSDTNISSGCLCLSMTFASS